MGPSRYATISQQRALQNLGLSIEEANELVAGKLILTHIGNPGGEDTVVLAQFANGRLSVGIQSIEDASGTGARAFGTFRALAFDIARALGVNEVDLFGAQIINPEVRAMLIRQGFRPATVEEFNIFTKTVSVP
jgi:hypothetical protein